MPKNPEIKKVLVIGSGPIVIGQAAKGREDTVRFFFLNQLLDNLSCQRLNIYPVRDILICHDRCRV